MDSKMNDDQLCKKELESSIECADEVIHTLQEEIASVKEKFVWLENNWYDQCCNHLKEKIKSLQESIKILRATESLDPAFIKSLEPAESASDLLKGLAEKFIEMPLSEFLQQMPANELEASSKEQENPMVSSL